MTDVNNTADIVKFRKSETDLQRARRLNKERQKRWRDRQRAGKLAESAPPAKASLNTAEREPSVRPAFRGADTSVTRRYDLTAVTLRAASIALAAVGLSMNAVYAHSLGSSDISGWLFLALGVAADASALCLPSVAASAPKRIQRIAAWTTWAIVFAFAIIGSVGFASTSISDVTALRSSRVTPAVTEARLALGDALAARDRECKGGVGKFCRQREDAVTSARQTLESAMHDVAQGGDPQAQALVRIVTWVSRGAVAPSEGDVGMLRLILFALLPQVGGVLLMVSRR
jgi:hypothetical protein